MTEFHTGLAKNCDRKYLLGFEMVKLIAHVKVKW